MKQWGFSASKRLWETGRERTILKNIYQPSLLMIFIIHDIHLSFISCFVFFFNLYKTSLLEFTKLDFDRTLRTRLVQNHIWIHETGPRGWCDFLPLNIWGFIVLHTLTQIFFIEIILWDQEFFYEKKAVMPKSFLGLTARNSFAY